ncbi:MAG: TIGR00730 family Rossman fold protein [Clostridia bacterium]|nr:TIGR00730 family Rossman fold protein [Clostridia bacterium]
MKICVYGAASPTIDESFIKTVEVLGEKMAQRGHSLVFGGGGNGLMGAAARGVTAGGGNILGVVPSFFVNDGELVEALYEKCDKMVYTKTMRERKQIMEDNAEAFIVTPGGIGTFEEFFEILTLKQLRQHEKPIAVYNINGYYNELQAMMHAAIEKGFIKKTCLQLYRVTNDIDELFDYIENDKLNIKSVKELKDG